MTPQQEGIIEGFEKTWRTGRRPVIGAVLHDAAIGQTQPEQRTLAIELVKVDLEYGWRTAHARGRKSALQLEAYAGALPILGPVAQLPLDLIAEEYRVRRRFGDSPPHQEYFARFSHPRGELAAVLEAVDRELAEEGLPVAPRSRMTSQLVRRTIDPQAPLYYRDYVLKRQIGAGGLCRVYAGVQLSLHKEVAIKVLRRRLWNSVEAVNCFAREAKIVAQLPREGIVGIHGLGRLPRGGYFMVMDLVDGLDLRARRNAAEISPIRTARWVAAAAEIVQRVHASGYIHGDLKPANVLVEHSGGVLVTDFGFSAALNTTGSPWRNQLLGGTPAFLAPECTGAEPVEVTPAIDVFGLGGILFWLLSSRAVHEESSLDELQRSLTRPTWDARVRDRIPASAPTGLGDLCSQCLARHPGDRPSIKEVARQCRSCLSTFAGGA